MEIQDFCEEFRTSGFKVLLVQWNPVEWSKHLMPKASPILPKGSSNIWKKTAKSLGAKGLAFIKSENGEWKSPILKFLSDDEKNALRDRLQVEDGDVVFFAAGAWESSCNILGRVRLESATLLEKRGQNYASPRTGNSYG